MKAVTLGPEGTYSHRAARSVADVVEFRESVTAIVEAVADGQYERGVVPIENSIEGSVTETLDVLADNDLAVVEEIVTPIRHALLAQDETFETVASHSQALAQCREYLSETYPEADLEAVASTARGVEIAREDPTVAGIGHPDNASGQASEGSQTESGQGGTGLQVLAEDIQDRNSNATRFFVVAPIADRSRAGGKSTFIVYPNDDYPGLLLDLLEPFADRDINLTRVESRPSGERLGDYVFHIDIAAGLYEDRTEQALADIDQLAADGWIRRLGSYDTSHVV